MRRPGNPVTVRWATDLRALARPGVPCSLDGLEGVAEAGAVLALRALIAGAYLALCAVGLVG